MQKYAQAWKSANFFLFRLIQLEVIIMEKPIVLVIMDGVGKGDGGRGDAVKVANTPTLDNLLATCPILT